MKSGKEWAEDWASHEALRKDTQILKLSVNEADKALMHSAMAKMKRELEQELFSGKAGASREGVVEALLGSINATLHRLENTRLVRK